MRVIFLSFHLPLPEEPGAFRPWMEARLIRDLGCEVTVVTSAIQYMTGEDLRGGKRGWCVEERREGIRILRVWGLRNYRISLWRRLLHYLTFAILAGMASLVRAGRVDRVLVGTDPVFITPFAWIIAWFKGGQLVLDERDLYPETALALGVLKPGLTASVISIWQRSLRRSARHILAATPGIGARLLDLGVPAKKMRVLYNADVYLYGENQQASEVNAARHLLERHAPPGASFIVVYAGGMGRANDVDTLLDAAEILHGERDIGFVLAGDGERRTRYEQRIHSVGLNAVMAGPLPRNTARQLIRGADTCAHMYPDEPLFAGALASKVLDYMALGKPVVFCGEGDTVEVITAAGCGICCPPGDSKGLAEALLRLRDRPEQCKRMGQAARQWFEGHVGMQVASAIMAWALEMEGVT
ncbi:MAG TPA: glycosyltransferase family 4 protein [Gammaproteobacteria bacterium]|nr:glycosyltransferase family 4 protein [Gammaproteobacteria bacterium]